jgi:hypothetical protein
MNTKLTMSLGLVVLLALTVPQTTASTKDCELPAIDCMPVEDISGGLVGEVSSAEDGSASGTLPPIDLDAASTALDPCAELTFGILPAHLVDACAPQMERQAALVQLPIGVGFPQEGNALLLNGVEPSVRCKVTPATTDQGGHYGAKKCTAGGHANTAWIFYCVRNSGATCPTTNGSSHVNQADCVCGDLYYDWEWYIEFTNGAAGAQGSSGSWPNTTDQVGIVVGQTVAQNLNGNQRPTGYFESGVTLD